MHQALARFLLLLEGFFAMTKPDLIYKIQLDHIPDVDLKGIGLVALTWSYLEGAVERIAWLGAGLSEEHGLCLTTHTGIKQRYDAALAILRVEFPDSNLVADFKKLENLITSELYGLRNEIVHSRVFYPGGDTSLRRTYKARGRIKSEIKTIDAEDYQTTAGKILDATNQVVGLLNRLYPEVERKLGAPPPWPGTA